MSEEEIKELYKVCLIMANDDRVYPSMRIEFRKKANFLKWLLQEDNQ